MDLTNAGICPQEGTVDGAVEVKLIWFISVVVAGLIIFQLVIITLLALIVWLVRVYFD